MPKTRNSTQKSFLSQCTFLHEEVLNKEYLVQLFVFVQIYTIYTRNVLGYDVYDIFIDMMDIELMTTTIKRQHSGSMFPATYLPVNDGSTRQNLLV